MVAHKLYDVAVPPAVVPDSLELEIVEVESETLPGVYSIQPAPLPRPGEQGDVSGRGRVEMQDRGEQFPSACVTLLSYSQMRKWNFVRLNFTPFQYDVESGQLTVTSRVTVRVNYAVSGIEVNAALMRDRVMDDLAAQMFINYDAARDWYVADEDGGLRSPVYDYVIITTNAVEIYSNKLSAFVNHKEALGHAVLVVTEDDFGAFTGQPPNQRADKIRQWLQGYYTIYGIEYVLLMGDPHPDQSGEAHIPMKMCWPRHGAIDYPEYQEAPTDYFYADLTGNWDYDCDQYYGEWGDDYGMAGGVDLTPEVYVGRIPVYDGDYGTLDNILQKIMDYESESGDLSWRKSVLLPMSFYTETYDGAPLAEQMRDDYLNSAGYSSWRQYQQANGACGLDSIYPSEEELRGGTVVRDRWMNDHYGIVCWWGHGSETDASVGCDGCWDGTLFTSSYASDLDDHHPSFTYQCSELNGYPENSENLQYAILKNGGIGTVGATRVSWSDTGVDYGDFDGSTTNSGIGYEYVKRLVEQEPAGEALYLAKSSMTPSADYWLMNYYDFNLYGDPTVGIASIGGVQCNDPYEPNDTWEGATFILYGTTLTDPDICPPGDVDYYAFTGSAGDDIIADIDAWNIGSSVDSYLYLYDTDGVTVLTENDDYDGLDSHIEYTLPANGTYYLMVREDNHPNEGGPDYFYTLSLTDGGDQAKWTFLVYLDGDNNLEGLAIDDFLEMSSVGSTSEVNIVVEFDRIPGYDSSYGDWTSTKRFVVSPEMTPDPGNEVEDIGEANMGDPQTLIDFVEWGMINYPADRYAVIVWDHGSGWRLRPEGRPPFKAVAFDDTNGGDRISGPELRSAMNALSINGVDPLDLVGFDACLMGMIEVDNQLIPYAEVRVGSEEFEYGGGWPYDTILAALTGDPDMSAAQLGTVVVDDYYASYGNHEVQSAVDLDTPYSDLNTAVNDFAVALINGVIDHHSEMVAARSVSQEFDSFTHIDLYDFAYQIDQYVSDATINAAATEVMNAVNNAVILERHGASWPGAHGISIYFPELPYFYDSIYDGDQGWLQFTADTQWDEWLHAFYGGPGEALYYLPLVMKDFVGVGVEDLVNGDFERGPAGWVEYSTYGWDLIVISFPGSVTPRSGSWAVWLGGESLEIAYVQQQVVVPVGSPYLAYWHWIASEDSCGHDFGGVIINGIVVDVYDLCTSTNTGGWVKHVVDLSAYAGQSVLLQIRAETSSDRSNLFIDDVSFQATASSARDSRPISLNSENAMPKSVEIIPQDVSETSTDAEILLRPE